MSEDEKTVEELIETRGRWGIFIKLFVITAIVSFAAEAIGAQEIELAVGELVFLPLLWAMLIAVSLTPRLLGSLITPLKKIITSDVMETASPMIMIVLMPLGVRYGTLVGPNIPEIIAAGPALILQEFGNMGTMFLALPFALMLGLKRESIGASISIAREPGLGVIGEVYGLDSPEGRGILGVYITGSIIGTLAYSIIGSLAPILPLHPLALAMACGMGSASMMTAASAALSQVVDPAYSDQVLAYAATSNMLTGVTGVYMITFINLPLINFLYRKLEPKIGDGEGDSDET